MPPLRPDETYHRLLFWTYAQALSERLAGHLLAADGYTSLDPSHPLGGPDQGADATCKKDGHLWVMASYFTYGPDSYSDIEAKLLDDIEAGRHREPHGFAFVCNQKITNGQRAKLKAAAAAAGFELDVFHLERNVHILDQPAMAQIREQYVYLPATGLPPLDIRAWVVGTAHAFTEDADLLDAFVAVREKKIRERSDEGHARVRAEQEAEAREEGERRAREAAGRARAARERPWDVASQLPMGDILGASRIFENFSIGMPAVEPVHFSWMGEKPKPAEPLSEGEIQAKVADHRSKLEARWPACRDYLASVAWPALHIRIANNAESFLTKVQVILTFHGARGIRYRGLSGYKLQRVENPEWQPPGDPRFRALNVDPLDFARPRDYPIDWRHDDNGDLEVTVELPELRPHPEWRSEHHGDDLVLVLDPDSDAEQIAVSWTATAHPYGKPFVGEPFTVKVDRMPMRDVLRETDQKSKKAS